MSESFRQRVQRKMEALPIVDLSGIVDLRGGSYGCSLPDEPSSPRAPDPSPVVRASASGVRLLLPEHALRAGLSDLRLARGAHVSLEDYASGVAAFLVAASDAGFLCLPEGMIVERPHPNIDV